MRAAVRLASLLTALVVAVVTPAAGTARSAQDAPVARKLAQALRVPHIPPARSAGLAFDLSSGRVLFAQNSARSFAPASTEKLPLTYVLLRVLGPGFRIQTDVVGIGSQDGSTWRGSLVLQGRGDPTLSRADLASLAAQLRATGVRRVTGSIVGDESWFDSRRTAPGWRASFYINESPPLSALTVDRARFGGRISREPALAAALLFRDALRKAGVSVGGVVGVGRAPVEAYPLASVLSPTLAALVREMDLESDNFAAELLLKELGAVVLARGTTAAGALVVTRELESVGVPMAGVRFADGSGLSRLDRLTVNALVAVLQLAWNDPEIRRPLYGALPVAGVNGTLEDRMRRPPARGNVVAKTGTTRGASGLAGYARGRYAFAVLQNGNPLSWWWARVAQDRFATVLAGN